MSRHRLASDLDNANFPASGYLAKVLAKNKHLIRYGAGAPTGTPDAFLYIDTTATTGTGLLYINVSGSWASVVLTTA